MRAEALLGALPERLRGGVREHTYEVRETVFRQGDPTRFLHVLRHGRVSLRRVLEDGMLVTMHVAEPGETFAEAALFSEAHHCDCVADEASVVATLPKADLVALIASDAAFASSLVELLSGQVQALRSRLALRNIKSARQRVLAWLAAYNKDGAVKLDRPLKASATEIGLAPEVLYRTLATLERDGSIRRTGGRIELSRDMISVMRSHGTDG